MIIESCYVAHTSRSGGIIMISKFKLFSMILIPYCLAASAQAASQRL